MSDHAKQLAAVRKLLHSLAYADEEERAAAADRGEDWFTLVDKAAERVNRIEENNAELREELARVESRAETAYSVAGETADRARPDGGPSKTKRAELLSRNEVVQQAITSSGNGGSVTAGQVKQMAKPETNLYHQQVRNAWEKLQARWTSFRIQERDDRENRLVADVDDLEEDLVRVVDEDLSEKDLAKRFFGEVR